MQSLSNLNFDTYGYSFSDMMGGNNNGMGSQQQQQQQAMNGGNMLPMIGNQNCLPMQGMSMQLVNDQGLSPPYSNHSPPHSVQSSAALSPPGCIGKENGKDSQGEMFTNHWTLHSFTGSPSPAKCRPGLPTSPTHIVAMRQATHQKHGQSPGVNGNGGPMNGNMMSPQMLGMDQMQQHQQQQHMQQQQGTYDVLDTSGYCSPSNGKMMQRRCIEWDLNSSSISVGQASSHVSVMSPNNNSCHSTISNHSAMQMGGGQQQQGQTSSFYQYFTPPSQHSGGATPQHLAQTLDSYPTPSPESPGDWSSSSPHSNSDWSEGVQSPQANNVYVTGGHQANKGTEAIYI